MIARWSTGVRPYALLLLLCLGLYLPGIAALPVLDRDEARFAQASRQMLESGDFLHISFQQEARNKKPVGIYWLQAASVAALSDAESAAIWPYRLPSLVGALAAVLLTFALGKELVGRPAALLGAALLASTLLLAIEAHLAKTDATLLACVAAAQGALALLYRDGRAGVPSPRRWALLFWAAQGVGLLIKGPIVPLLSLLTAGALSIADRDARWLRRLQALWGVPLMLALAAPWFVAITVATPTPDNFWGEAGHDFFGKLLGAQETHGAPPGYYLLLLAATFWPGSLLLAPAFVWAWRERGEPAARFLIAWVVPFWIGLELAPTKLPHYILPAYPALALLAACASLALARKAAPTQRWLEAIVTALWLAASLALAAALVLAPQRWGRGLDVAGTMAGAVILVLGCSLAVAAWRHAGAGLTARSAVLALLVFAPAFAFVAPGLDGLWLSRAAAEVVQRYRPPRDAPVVAVGYSEPSLVFLLGTRTRSLSPDAAAQYITSARGAAALVSERDDAAFRQALGSRGWQPRLVDRVDGLDYSNGQPMVLTLYTGVPG
jgi:4-amino-4-deoxy-L-arabinose transferase-like glycosyltransferase